MLASPQSYLIVIIQYTATIYSQVTMEAPMAHSIHSLEEAHSPCVLRMYLDWPQLNSAAPIFLNKTVLLLIDAVLISTNTIGVWSRAGHGCLTDQSGDTQDIHWLLCGESQTCLHPYVINYTTRRPHTAVHECWDESGWFSLLSLSLPNPPLFLFLGELQELLQYYRLYGMSCNNNHYHKIPLLLTLLIMM